MKLCVQLLLLSLFFSQVTNALELTSEEHQWINENPIIRTAGAPDWAPFDYKNDDDQHLGIAQDYLQLIESKTGLKFEVTIDQWFPHLRKAYAGELDLMPAVAGGDSSTQELNFTQSYETIYDYLFINEELTALSLQDISELTVTMPSGFARRNYMTEQFPGIKIINTQSLSESVELLLAGQANLILGDQNRINQLLEDNNINSIIPYQSVGDGVSNRLFMAVPDHARPLVGILDKAILSITDEEKQQIINLWIAKQPHLGLKIELTEQEQQWINSNPVVVFGADRQWAPFEFKDEQGFHRGIAADYIELIEGFTGLSIDVVPQTWSDVLVDMKAKKLQGLTCAVKTSERTKYLDFTSPYLSVPTVIYVKTEDDIESISDLSGRSVALNQGSYVHEWLKKNHPEINLYLTSSNIEAVESVSYGQADAYIGNVAVADYAIQNSMLTNLKVVDELFELQTSVSIAVDKDLPELYSIMTKALDLVTETQHKDILKKWVSRDFNELRFTADERTYINQKEQLTLLSQQHNMPIEGFNENGTYIGINADIIARASDLLDLEINVIDDNALKHDLIFSHIEDDTIESSYQTINSHIKTPVVIVMPSGQSFVSRLEDIKSRKIGALEQSGFIADVHNEINQIRLELYSDLTALTDALYQSQLDAILLPFSVAKYHLQNEGIDTIKIVGKTRFTEEFAYFIDSNQPLLKSVLSKTLVYISSENNDITNQWLEIDVLQSIDYKLAALIAAILSVVLFFIIYWNRSLASEIQQRQLVETHLANEKANFEVMFKQSADPGLIYQNSRFVDCNQAVVDMFGFKDQENMLTSEISSLMPEKQPSGQESLSFLTKMLFQSMHEGSVRFECLVKKQNGELFWVDAIFTRIVYNGEKALHVVWRDISKQKALQKNLSEARKEADQANQAKSAFLANMSHEIRTPMNAILGFTDLLNEQIKQPHLKSFVKTIKSAGDTLLLLINDILDLSKIEAGKVEINKAPFNPREYFEDVSQIFSIDLQKKGLQLILDINDDVPQTLIMDGNHLRQVIYNLLGNAIKFSELGRITLSVSTYNQSDDYTGIKISVADEGIGIPAEEQDQIFDAFEQQKQQDKNKYSGTGLGLAITKQLVEQMDGEIHVESEVGKGSKFIMNFGRVSFNQDVTDFSAENPGEMLEPSQYRFKKACILIADDNYHNRALVAEYFSDSKITTIHAENGLDALNCLEKYHVDLVLMDIRMPVMDGYESAKRIKKNNPELPLIALTASVLSEEHERIQAGNFDGYLPKPVIKARLFEMVAKFIEFETIMVEASEHDVEQVLDEEQKVKLHDLIRFLKGPVSKSWELAKATQKISDVEVFVSLLSSAKQHVDLNIINQYIEELESDIASFNIVGIDQNLKEFENKIQFIENLSQS